MMGVLENYKLAMDKAVLENRARLATLKANITCEIELFPDSRIPWLKVALTDLSVNPPDVRADYWNKEDIENIDMDSDARDHVDELIEDLLEYRTS